MFICRLQEKILDVESENQILRQKSLLHTSGQLPPTPAKVYLSKIYFAFSGIMITKIVLSYLQNSQNGHFSSKESLINVSRVLTFFPFSPELRSNSLYVFNDILCRGLRLKHQQEPKNLRQRLGVCKRNVNMYAVQFSCYILCFWSVGCAFFDWREIFFFLVIGECWCSYQLRNEEHWIQPREACSGIYYIQMPPSLEILWSWKNQRVWSSCSNDWFCYQGTKLHAKSL